MPTLKNVGEFVGEFLFMISYKILPLKNRLLKNGDCPLYLRIIHNRVKKEYSLKLSCNQKNYDFEINRFKRNKFLNRKLVDAEYQVTKIIQDLDSTFNFQQFEDQYFERNSKASTILESFSQIIAELRKEERIGTAVSYECTLSSLSKSIGVKTTLFAALTSCQVKQYKAFLETKELSKATIGIYLRTLKAAYNKCVLEPKSHPFMGIKIPTGNKGKLALNKEQMHSLFNCETNDYYIRRSLDWFMLSYLCRGINFTDLTSLRYSKNIIDNKIKYQRKKTARTLLDNKYMYITVTTTIQAILEKYKTESDFLLPVLKEEVSATNARERCKRHLKLINKHIKLVAAELKISGHNKLTYYCARHSYARTLQLSDCNINLISQCLGHSSPQTTLNYLSTIEQDKIDASDALLY